MKVKLLILENGLWTVVAIWLFTWFNVNHALSSIWVVLLHHSVPFIIIMIVGLENCQKFKCSKTVSLSLLLWGIGKDGGLEDHYHW